MLFLTLDDILEEEKVSGLFFSGLPRGRRGEWRFRCREIGCTQFPSPKGEPRLTLVRTALSSAAVSGLLTRSAHRGERAMGQAESRRGSRPGSSSHRFSAPHVQSSAGLTSPARKALRSTYRGSGKSHPLCLHVLVFPTRHLIRA